LPLAIYTLSAFFREYLYIPLGGNRRGLAWQAYAVAIVFLLTGLWHGAGWTFIIWGGVHGALVLINHLWSRKVPIRIPRAIARTLTMIAVVGLWVVFRSPSWPVAEKVLTAMTFSVPATGSRALPDALLYGPAWLLTGTLGAVALFLPNSRRVVRHLRRGRIADRGPRTIANPTTVIWSAAVTATILYFAIASIGSLQSKFIYFNF
jgi:hypothetical protein